MRLNKTFALALAALFAVSSLVTSPLSAARGASMKKAAKAEKKEEPSSEEKEAKKETEENVEEKAEAPKEEIKEEATEEAVKDKVEEAKESSPSGFKSPGLAGGLAVFPGVAVHGIGHMYAGSWVKGLGLLAVEIASTIVVTQHVTTVINDLSNYSSNTIPTDVSSTYTALGVTLVGTFAFLYTWIDDMAGAPIAAHKYNERMNMQQSTLKLRIAPMPERAAIGLGITKTF